MKDKLKDIINGGANGLTNADKSVIKSIAIELGVELPKNVKCKDCYIDVAFALLRKLEENDNEPKSGLRLKKGVRILVNGAPINNVTCATEEDCEKALALGTPRKYFER